MGWLRWLRWLRWLAREWERTANSRLESAHIHIRDEPTGDVLLPEMYISY